MRKITLVILLAINMNFIKAQSCEEIIEYVKKEGGYGTTFTSFESDVISKVTFYQINVDYKNLYFAIVCFKKENIYGCAEHIYQVVSNTKFNYSINYINSAGKAFWEFIQPYNGNLGCAPKFK